MKKLLFLMPVLFLIVLPLTFAAIIDFEETHSNADASGDSLYNYYKGMNISFEQELTLVGWKRFTIDGALMVYLYNCSTIATCQLANESIDDTRIDQNFTTPITVYPNIEYYLMFHGNGTNWECRYDDVATYPEDTGNVTWEQGVISTDDVTITSNDNNFWEVETLVMQLDTAPAPTFSGNQRNVSTPLQNAHVGFDINISSSNNVTGWIFAFDNGTGGQFYNSSFVELPEIPTIANATYNITLYNSSGTAWRWKWFANDSYGVWGTSDTYTVTVGGTAAPVLTIAPHNFFSSDNTAYINNDVSEQALINLTLTDDVANYGINITITNPSDVVVYNMTNSTLHGEVYNYTTIANITGETDTQGTYTVTIVTWDSHTALAISDYDVIKGKDYLLFDDKIRITADKATSSKTHKLVDRYDFEFEYSKLFTPSKKVFYVESDGVLEYIIDSEYVGHFVDWKNKRWIDFEGLEGKPIITKINDNKYKIEFNNADEKVIFSSIGGLNSQLYSYNFYVVNPTLTWLIPTETTNFFINQSITVSLNVTSDYRNETRFRLYNSSKDLVDSYNLSNEGTGSYFYNATFTSLTGSTYYVNATHYDAANSTTNSTTVIFSTAYFNISFYDEILEELITPDVITLEVIGTGFAQNYSTTTGKIGVAGWTQGDYRLTYVSNDYGKRSYYYTLSNATNYSISLYLLTATNGTDVTFTVQDNSGNELSNATIYLKKYYVSTNSYRTVAMERTNEEGEASIDVDFNDAYYQILVNYGDFSLQTIGSKIISTTRILTLDLLADPFGTVDALDGVTTSLSFNNLTQTFSYVFLDTTGTQRTATLDVIKTTPTTDENVCTTTDTSVSGTLLCTVNTTAIPGTYTAKGYISINPKILTNTYQIITGIARDFQAVFGTTGIFLTILLAGCMAGLGAMISPAVAIIMFVVGIAIASFMGMSMISTVFLCFLILGAIILIFKMKR